MLWREAEGFGFAGGILKSQNVMIVLQFCNSFMKPGGFPMYRAAVNLNRSFLESAEDRWPLVSGPLSDSVVQRVTANNFRTFSCLVPKFLR